MDLQPQQQADMSNPDIDAASNQPLDSTCKRVNPFTPTQPSTMHVNDLPDDCIRLFLEYFETLHELVSMAFVCPRWVSVVYQIVRTRQDSLKVFDSEKDISLYQDCALMQYNLIKLDPNAGVKQPKDKQEDHIFSRSLPRENIETTLDVIVHLFDEVKSLVLQTQNLQMLNLIRDLKYLTSITLLYLPDSREKQNQIWTALNASPALLHVHLLRIDVITPFDVEKMDFLTRIESLTLDNYWHSNVSAILNRLSSDRCRCLQIGHLAQFEFQVLQKLVKENAAMVVKLTHFSIRLGERFDMEPAFPQLSQKYQTLRRDIFELISTHFKSLVYLDLEFVSKILSPNLHRLAELPHLTELRLGHEALYTKHKMACTKENPLQIDRQYPNIRTVYLTNFSNEFQLINSLFPSPQEAAGIIDPTDRLYQDVFSKLSLNNNEDLARAHELLANPNLLRGVENENRLETSIRTQLVQGNRLLDQRPCLFPQLEKVIFVLDSRSFPEQSFENLRPSIRNWIPGQFWNRCAVFETAVGTLNSTYFGGDAQDLANNPPWTVVLQPRRYLLESIKKDDVNGFLAGNQRVQNVRRRYGLPRYISREYRIRIDNRILQL